MMGIPHKPRETHRYKAELSGSIAGLSWEGMYF